MQIERHRLPDGAESIVKRMFQAEEEKMREQMAEAYKEASAKETLEEIKQVRFDPEDPCPCGGLKKAKNCCAGRLLRRLAKERDGG